jgi:hypothetical protein
MVITESLLAQTVRQTAIHAHRASIQAQLPTKFMGKAQNFKDRLDELATLSHRHCMPNASYAEYLFSLFDIDPTHEVSPVSASVF